MSHHEVGLISKTQLYLYIHVAIENKIIDSIPLD